MAPVVAEFPQIVVRSDGEKLPLTEWSLVLNRYGGTGTRIERKCDRTQHGGQLMTSWWFVLNHDVLVLCIMVGLALAQLTALVPEQMGALLIDLVSWFLMSRILTVKTRTRQERSRWTCYKDVEEPQRRSKALAL